MNKKDNKTSLYDGRYNLNPKEISFLELIKEDFNTHDNRFCYGFIALAVHRLGNLRMNIKWKPLRVPFSILYKALFILVEIICGIKLSYNVKVGRRVKIEHFGGMILGAREIGNDVIIRQNTTFGIKDKNNLCGKPTIGNNVDIGCGVVILGNIKIGDSVVIGANSVITKDIPGGVLVAGVPGRVIKDLDECGHK